MPTGLLNALTFDVEDWYQGIELAPSRWGEFERRLERGLNRILALLAEHDVKATFFVLGQCALDHPELIASIAASGHEIATHGLSHTKVYDLDPARFEDELAESMAVLHQVTGQPIRGHRAPYFSITNESLWALDILARHGLDYDASIYPGQTWRYGIPDAPRQPYRLTAQAMVEVPTSVFEVLGKRVGLGGAYFRILPYFLTLSGIRQINRAGHPAVFYLHPWELDPDHPRVEFDRRAQRTHYAWLRTTEPRLGRLLRDVRFGTVQEMLAEVGLSRGPGQPAAS